MLCIFFLISRTISYFAAFGAVCFVALTLISYFEGDTAIRIQAMKDGTHNPYRDFNQLVNSIFFTYSGLGIVPGLLYNQFGDDAGYYIACYLRDLVLGTAVYWGTAAVWHFCIYTLNGEAIFTKKNRPFPAAEVIIDQMQLAQASLFLYAALPILSEYLIENNLTHVYFYLDEVGGWKNYVLYLMAYITCFEFGIYWMHRTLHTNKFLYKYVHGMHHKYNKSSTLTPWASIAFNPIDGILQVSIILYIYINDSTSF
jgi:lathosterol oxidase